MCNLVLPMLAQQRHDRILDSIRRDGSVRVRELAALLEVSDMTVRRDLDVLEGRQLLDKVHGGAILVRANTSFEPGFDAKQSQQSSEKGRIARAAANLVAPGSAIGLTAGTTTWSLAKLLLEVPNLTVVTNAPSIARVFYEGSRADQTIVLTGGVRTPSDALVGPVATGALSSLYVDMVFMGVHGMDFEVGFSTPNLAEAEVNMAFLHSARRVTVLADHTKWGTRGLAKIAPLEAADIIISDTQLSPAAIDAFADADLRLV